MLLDYPAFTILLDGLTFLLYLYYILYSLLKIHHLVFYSHILPSNASSLATLPKITLTTRRCILPRIWCCLHFNPKRPKYTQMTEHGTMGNGHEISSEKLQERQQKH